MLIIFMILKFIIHPFPCKYFLDITMCYRRGREDIFYNKTVNETLLSINSWVLISSSHGRRPPPVKGKSNFPS